MSGLTIKGMQFFTRNWNPASPSIYLTGEVSALVAKTDDAGNEFTEIHLANNQTYVVDGAPKTILRDIEFNNQK